MTAATSTESRTNRGRNPWWVVSDSLAVTRRNVLRNIRNPQFIVFSTIQPIMFVLLFAFVFGGAIDAPGSSYRQFLIPGIMVQTAVFGATNTAIGLADDLSRGMIDRFRSLPMARSAVLSGRTLADAARNAFVVLLIAVVGFAIGFRLLAGLVPGIAALGLAVLFGYTFSWVFAFVGLKAGDVETAQASGFVWVFPLVFASSAFVPAETMPSWLRVFADNQPVTQVVDTIRALTTGGPVRDALVASILWMVAILVVFVPLSVREYRRAAAKA